MEQYLQYMQKTKLAISKNLILTAGPAIDYREVEYAADAALNGWNHHHSDYLKRFENLFKNYVGVNHGFATSSCTGALHLALKAKGIGPGDEVIVPETSWIATAAAVVYTGATPIFADIEADTWVLDSNRIERYITPRTKAIIPVHLYGQPVNMEPIWAVAEKYGLFILEDAAPSIGSIYKGKKTGSLGHAAAFSFQGAKAVVTGEGGFFLTNDEELQKRAWFINDHGRDPNRALYNIEIGHKYKMSNIQAAIGLAQMEKIEDIVAQKRQIFSWYQDRLGDIEELSLNVEKADTRNIFWMSSIVLDSRLNFTRDEFMKELKARNVDSRPMFYPMSSFPMFNSAESTNPVAYSVPLRGINLPSGHDRTEEEIDYVCAHIRDLLGKGIGKTSLIQPYGKVAHQDKVERFIEDTKNPELVEQNTIELFDEKGNLAGYLKPLTYLTASSSEQVKLLASWREKIQSWFPSQFKVTEEGTKRWVENGIINLKDRVLYWVLDFEKKPIGHVGLFRFNHTERYCELDNIVRGVDNASPGIIRLACEALVDLCKNKLDQNDIYLRVFSDNEKALRLYNKMGFKEIQRSPLRKIVEGDTVKWLDVIKSPYEEVSRYFVTMKLEK